LTRTRSLFVGIFVVLFLALPVGGASAASSSSQMMRKINQFRHAHGLRSLRVSGLLRSSSARYARKLVRSNSFRHSRGGRARSSFRRFGENLAYHTGTSPRVRGTLRAWARSSSHRRVLLDSRVRWIGAGRAAGRMGGRMATVWVLRVGSK
jgi:uncharacterized protein YkwD